jgi:hypothetical protein
MSSILKYKPFLENYLSRHLDEYNEELKRIFWGKRSFDANLIDATNMIFGKGTYELCDKRYDYICDVLSKISITWVDDMLVKVYDQFGVQSISEAFFVIFYSNDEYNPGRINGFLGINPKDLKSNKSWAIAHMLQDGLVPEEEKWPLTKSSRTNWTEIKVKENLNFKDIVNNYKPGISIRIGRNHSGDGMPSTKEDFAIKDIEKSLDNILPLITEHLPLDEIIWDLSRGSRRFTDEDTIKEYDVKLILK